MPSPDEERYRRRNGPGSEDQRTAAQRDRDRILYSSAFRRLAGVTQVVGPFEGHIFHNRLTHTLEVAQIARRVAEKFVADPASADLIAQLGGINPDVVEAAALVHDLGHPPFGHAGEEELNRLAFSAGASDGFEGNPQSFRIVTRLAAHRLPYKGLNLTRATLNASLKYPHYRKERDDKLRKFGAYDSDALDFTFAREGSLAEALSPEAQIMDFADGVAYSVHDLDDFFRAGLIPLDQLCRANTDDFDRFIEKWKQSPIKGLRHDEIDAEKPRLLAFLKFNFGTAEGAETFKQRTVLRSQTATLISKVVTDVRLQERDAKGLVLHIPDDDRVLLGFCQRLVWNYVICNPRLATQQYGQRQVIKTLFNVYKEAVEQKDTNMVPPRYHDELRDVPDKAAAVRLAVDIVASLTDGQAGLLYRRLAGIAIGSVTDLL